LIANTLSMEFKSFQSLVVEPASISIAQFSDSQARLIQFNRSHETLAEYLQQLKSAPSQSMKPTLGGEVRAKSGVH